MDEGVFFSPLDRFLSAIHVFLRRNRLAASILALACYAAAVLLFGKRLEISSNYLVIVPVLVFSIGYGFWGGALSGLAGLPANLILFRLLGHNEFSPASKLFAELSGLLVGCGFGYLSDYYRKLTMEFARRVETEDKLRSALDEKDLLLKEVHHRVKNNLNIIKSLVSLQADRSGDPGFKRESRLLIDRIFSISLVQELLYSSHSLDSIDLKDYLETLARNVVSGYESGDIVLETSIVPPPGTASMDAAVTLGLIVNEALTNSMKHALREGAGLRVSLEFRAEGETCAMSVSDDGPGFDLQAAAASGGLGITLIETLSHHLGGSYRYAFGPGTRFELAFPGSSLGNGERESLHSAERRVGDRRRVLG